MHWLLTPSRATWLALLALALVFGLFGTRVLLTYLATAAIFWSAYAIYISLKESVLKLLPLEEGDVGIFRGSKGQLPDFV